MRRCAVAAALLAGCFGPEARDGLPCSEAGDCPPGQSCQAGICTSQVVLDAAPPDAPPVDAAPPAEPGAFTLAGVVPLLCPTAVACVDVREPWLNADRTAILFTYAVNAVNGNFDIYYSSRPAGDGPFAQAASIGAINSTVAEHAAFLSADGTHLWFARQDISSGTTVRPYDEILLSTGSAGSFNGAAVVDGGVNTLLGDERSPQVNADFTIMLFTRSPESAMTDHDVYLARLDGGQWNTIDRVAALSSAGNENSLSLAEGRRAIFFIRDDQIHEAIWTGEDPAAIAVEVVHDELDAAPLDLKIGLWASADGTELWFDSNRSGAQQIYRAVRAAPTLLGSGGRIRRRPIR